MLILEAGDDHLGEAVIEVPAEVGAVVGNSNYDWVGHLILSYQSSNTRAAISHNTPTSRKQHSIQFSSVSNSIIYSIYQVELRCSGKILGGSSAINALIWDRASKAEYDGE